MGSLYLLLSRPQIPMSNLPMSNKKKSKRFWDSGQLIVFSTLTVTGKEEMFQLQVDPLQKHSKVMDEIFERTTLASTAPAGTSSEIDRPISETDGTVESPVKMAISAEEFGNFLSFINYDFGPSGSDKFNPTVDNILMLFKMAAFLQADGALDYAISQIPTLSLLPIQMLELAFQFCDFPQVHMWVEPATCALLEVQIQDFSPEETRHMGLAFAIIA
ncbi:hypothetical protein GYMLUDRAFT_64048 [Collybiopsis luxurians FD-317 M1]|uniref:BTB domain-containing protein n=1 Tax=Collybiopsis luxurians FD-317 M1 TaxID=944289 RepID=A0A0D0CCW6_9AGAR|nr:hypothetical protein GYMLUDRAFT_64048 [Collybiopsis luxurians FD-317 M1]